MNQKIKILWGLKDLRGGDATVESLGKVDLGKLSRSELAELTQLLTPKMTKYIIHKPYPKQAAFMLLDCKEAFYGG